MLAMKTIDWLTGARQVAVERAPGKYLPPRARGAKNSVGFSNQRPPIGNLTTPTPHLREIVCNSGSGLSALSGIGTELHKRRRRLGCSSLGLGGGRRRGHPPRQAPHHAPPRQATDQ